MVRKFKPIRLQISNLIFSRTAKEEVIVTTTGDRPVCTIRKSDWKKVGSFFRDISNRDFLESGEIDE